MPVATTRVLALLELLLAHGRLSGAEIAARLEIDRRTVRRYIAHLEAIGIPIATERGPHGAYELVPGFKLPPLIFTQDEVLAIALGLAAVRRLEAAPAAAVAGAQAKLERVMPGALKTRMRAVSESVSFAAAPGARAEPESLTILSSAAHARHAVRLRYAAPGSAPSTERHFDPFGLAFAAGRWYTAGYCHLRGGLRTFRLDRIEFVEPVPDRTFERPAHFDVAAHVIHAIATLPREFSIEVRLDATIEQARRELFPSIGLMEPLENGRGVLLRSQADDLDWFARELARLPFRFTVAAPAGLNRALARLTGVLAASARQFATRPRRSWKSARTRRDPF